MPRYDWPPKPLPSTDAALRDVHSKKASFRRNAAISLGRAPADRADDARKALATLVQDEERTVRIEAVYAAASLGAEELAPAIRKMLHVDDPDLRVAALEYMVAVEDDSEASTMASLADGDGRVPVRCMALEALCTLRPAEGTEKLLAAISRGDQEVPVLRTALALLRNMEGDHAEPVAKLLDHRRPGVSLEAAATLAHLGDHRGRARLLTEAVNPAREEERYVALEGLCRIADDAVLNTARKRATGMLTRRDARVYWSGMLAARGDEQTLGRLRKLAGHRDPMRAALALRVAGLCSVTAMVQDLENIIRSAGEDETLVVESIEALGLMRTPEAADALARIARDTADPDRADHAMAAREEVRRWIPS